MAGCGQFDLGGTFVFDDAASGTQHACGTAATSGGYKPANLDGTFDMNAPAPAHPYSTALSSFNSVDPNGTWSLYVLDDSGGDSGSIGAWSITITSS
jgi:hypothetical protein